MNVALTIQEKLKDLRTERGLTLEQLEQQTGISKSAVGSYESEDFKDISHTSIITLAKFYGVGRLPVRAHRSKKSPKRRPQRSAFE